MQPGVRLVLLNLAVDLITMRTHVSPGISEIFSAERRIGAQQFGFGNAQSSRLFEHSNGTSRPHDARLAVADAGATFDAGESVAQIVGRPTQQLRFLGAREFGEDFFSRFQCTHRTLAL